MKKLFFILTVVYVSCTAKKKIEKNNQFIITMEQSYKYDLQKQVYTIYGVKLYDSLRQTYVVSGTPLEVKFKLSEEEKNKINEKYYYFKIDELQTKMIVDDSCFAPFPRLYHTLHVKADKRNQELSINLDCGAYGYPNYYKGMALKEFLNFCLKILRTKPEIKNAPISYLPYH